MIRTMLGCLCLGLVVALVLTPAQPVRAEGANAGEDETTKAAAPDKTVAPEQTAAPEKTVEEWIAELGSDSFDVREAATEALSKLTPDALPKLEEAASADDPEVRWRIEKAIKAIRARQQGEAEGEAEEASRPHLLQPGAPGGLPQMLEQLEKELGAMNPELDHMLKDLPLHELMPKDFGDVFKEMERSLRQLDHAQAGQPHVFQQFKTFRFKDGKWTIEEGTGQGPALEEQEPASPVGAFGLRAAPLSPVLRAQLRLAEQSGLALEEVRPGTQAAKLGLHTYDLILEVDGLPVSHPDDLELLTLPGSHQVAIMRGGARQTMQVTVGGEGEKSTQPRGF